MPARHMLCTFLRAQTIFQFIARAQQAFAFVQPKRHIEARPSSARHAMACASHLFQKQFRRATSNMRRVI
jgi:hypothetical protein